jgi:phage terminase large subunit-like protein
VAGTTVAGAEVAVAVAVGAQAAKSIATVTNTLTTMNNFRDIFSPLRMDVLDFEIPI